MWMCIQAYNVSTRSNNQVQTIVQTFSYINSTWPSGAPYTNYTFPTLPAEMHPTPDTNYSVTFLATEGFRQTLATMFSGTVKMQEEYSTPGSDAVDAIWSASANLDPWIKQVALSVTNALRNSTGQPSHTLYDGTGYQLGISVRWQWIALPAAMVLLSLIFLVMVMVQTARSEVDAWKGSPLAFLFFDVEQEMKRKVVGHTDEFNGIENAVADVRVMLRGQPGDIWTFEVDQTVQNSSPSSTCPRQCQEKVNTTPSEGEMTGFKPKVAHAATIPISDLRATITPDKASKVVTW